MRTQVVFPERYTWLHWWEANREEFLQPQPSSLGDQVAQSPEPPRDLRAKVVAALLQELRSQAWQGRMEAALALGRMGEDSAIKVLQQLASRDRSASVRQAAQAALALIGGPEAEKALLGGGDRSQPTAVGLSALAATTQPGEGTTKSLERIAKGRDPRASVAAARGLRGSGKAARADVFRDILATTKNPWLAIEAILGLGETADPQDIPVLSNLLLATDGAANMVQSWRSIQIARTMRLQQAGRLAAIARQGYQQELTAYDAERGAILPGHRERRPGSCGPEFRTPEWMVVPVGMEEIFLSHFRAAAAVALGRIDSPEARRVLAEALMQDGREWGGLSQDPNALARMNEFSDLHKGMAIMSLARNGDADSLPVLIDMLEGRIPNLADYSPERLKDSPLRGYAVLALGLYARPVNQGGKPTDRPKYELACDALAKRLADRQDTSEVRSAAALGLGVSSRLQNLQALQSIDVSRQKDMALAGYLLLGRAMLKDPEVTKLAEELLKRKPTDSLSDIVGSARPCWRWVCWGHRMSCWSSNGHGTSRTTSTARPGVPWASPKASRRPTI